MVRSDDTNLTSALMNGLEVLGIAGLVGLGLNSSHESHRPCRLPAIEVAREYRFSRLASLCNSAAPELRQQAVREALTSLVLAEIRFLKTPELGLSNEHVLDVNSAAHHAMLQALLSLPLWCQGRPLSLHVASDITLYDLRGYSSYSGATLPQARAGFLYWRHLKTLFEPAAEHLSSLEDSSSFLDLWPVRFPTWLARDALQERVDFRCFYGEGQIYEVVDRKVMQALG